MMMPAIATHTPTNVSMASVDQEDVELLDSVERVIRVGAIFGGIGVTRA